MRMDEGLDTGPIVAQARVPLEGDETAPSSRRAGEVARRPAHATSMPAVARGPSSARHSPTEGATLTRPLRREDGRLDPAAGGAGAAGPRLPAVAGLVPRDAAGPAHRLARASRGGTARAGRGHRLGGSAALGLADGDGCFDSSRSSPPAAADAGAERLRAPAVPAASSARAG